MLYLVLAVFGCLSGVTAVLFGFGGGFIVVPVLYRCLKAFHETGASPAAGSPAADSAMLIAVATSTCVMIVNAAAATRRHHAAGNVPWAHLFPLFWYVALGAALGALSGTQVPDQVLRWAFAAYVAATLADCLLRQGFMTLRPDAPAPQPLRHPQQAAAGTVIGTLATFLGVGGSVMTVPLLRRRGLPMRQAVAAANPLSLPVAVVGTLGYAALGQQADGLGAWHLGYIDLAAFAVLSASAWLGVRLGAPWLARISDRLHTRGYVALLFGVLLAMLFE
ncbi:sulfite exporter TauE/SafE family protein [Orrella sp. JC864]|uniref:sulfite exporter TauE/SafE family protein n=1 Tax=Orrella sp. JC864 TaxID=3120298 RepID=UPI0012BBF49B